eukprot:TRINITY_DN1565_c0_g1_i1.p1 TRINITY_DN1565_c0_g1~~TRINITY_DN1565_c0_g1_i1.p1  ORF type:complete len:373 (+),score=53.07 TRINITY_DN1565_c0_g1_i1:37-1155(+)
MLCRIKNRYRLKHHHRHCQNSASRMSYGANEDVVWHIPSSTPHKDYEEHVQRAWRFYNEVLGSPTKIAAPMVDGSTLPFRILSKRHGSKLNYTPMLYSGVYAVSEKYRSKSFVSNDEDRPLIVQFCGTDPEKMLTAALHAQERCDAIDINLGCPQLCASKHGYGSYMLETPELVLEVLSTLSSTLSVPVFCKIRIFDDLDRTIKLVKQIERHGCSLLVVHGRTKEQRGKNMGIANWDAIKAIKENLQIPVISNGNIQQYGDIQACMDYTGVDGVMSAQAMINNPAFFDGKNHNPCDIILEYFDICDELEGLWRPRRSFLNFHVYGIFKYIFNEYPEMRQKYIKSKTIEEMKQVFIELKEMIGEDKYMYNEEM